MSANNFSYEISSDKRSITCKLCGRTSYNGGDVVARYCANCRYFHNEPILEQLPMATLEKLLKFKYPVIEWRMPVIVQTPTHRRYVCRVCVAAYGLKSEDVGKWPETIQEFDEHMKQIHPNEN